LGLLFGSWQYSRDLHALPTASLFSLRFYNFLGVKGYFIGVCDVMAGTLKMGQWLAQILLLRSPTPGCRRQFWSLLLEHLFQYSCFPSKVKCLVLPRASANS
jgi:hypothetical protein